MIEKWYNNPKMIAIEKKLCDDCDFVQINKYAFKCENCHTVFDFKLVFE